MSNLIHGDCVEELKTLADNSIDAVITDPPYGYSFMGKDWDKAVPSVEIWQECLRVLKPGGWCMVMSAPRSDVQNAMISRLMEAGFRLDFTPIYWTYASGFPKAGNIGKLVDKRLGAVREVIGYNNYTNQDIRNNAYDSEEAKTRERLPSTITTATTPEAKALDGSYAGFQPKPAVEVIIVAMKPLSEKTYVDQALKNRKGVTWLDDARIPTAAIDRTEYGIDGDEGSPTVNDYGERQRVAYKQHYQGRFPANLLISDNILDDYTKFFDLDKWANTLPFLITPKASKSEKNKGLEHLDEKLAGGMSGTRDGSMLTGSGNVRNNMAKNHHPTVKPLKLMSYLITLTTRPGDTVLDPFVGSGTTLLAAKQLDRKGIGIEKDHEYIEIAKARVATHP